MGGKVFDNTIHILEEICQVRGYLSHDEAVAMVQKLKSAGTLSSILFNVAPNPGNFQKFRNAHVYCRA